MAVTAAQSQAAFAVAETVLGSDLPVAEQALHLATRGVIRLSQALPTTAATTATSVLWTACPFDITVDAVEAFLATADDATVIVDVNDNGTSILSTKLTLDANEKTSVTAATPAVISDNAIAKGSTITVDIDQGTAPAAGLTVLIHYTRTA